MCTTDVMARGVDFERVEVILQFDIPQNPEFFVHRIGRTARGVFNGKALLLLTQQERDYKEFLENKGISFQEEKRATQIDEEKFLKEMKKVMLRDRMNFIRANNSFISFIQSFKENQLKEIFKVENLDFKDLAKSMFVPSMPVIRETKKYKGWTEDEDYLEKFKSSQFRSSNQRKQFE